MKTSLPPAQDRHVLEKRQLFNLICGSRPYRKLKLRQSTNRCRRMRWHSWHNLCRSLHSVRCHNWAHNLVEPHRKRLEIGRVHRRWRPAALSAHRLREKHRRGNKSRASDHRKGVRHPPRTLTNGAGPTVLRKRDRLRDGYAPIATRAIGPRRSAVAQSCRRVIRNRSSARR